MRIQFILGNLGTEKTEPQPILDYGLHKVDSNPDIIIIHNRLVNKNVIMSKIPKIIIERADSSIAFQPEVRNNIHRTNILAVLKISCARNQELHNSEVCHKRYHCKLINDYAKLRLNEIQKPIKTEKIHCLIPSSTQQRFLNYKNLEIDFASKRKIDAHFVGATKYPNIPEPNLINWHRKQAVKQLSSIKNRKIHITQAVSKHHPMPHDKYMQLMINSKICVSPWGMGEWNYRDFQAMYAGCVLVKPNSNHVKMYPVDIFTEKHYVPCLPDFSDLQEKITHILDNWHDYEEMRYNNRMILLESWKMDLSSDFAYFIKGLM